MKKQLYSFLSVVATISLVLGAAPAGAGEGSRKIVTFDPVYVNGAAQDALIKAAGGVKIKNLDLIGGAAVYLPDQAAETALAKHSGVLRVEDDVRVEAFGKLAPAQPAESLPWGVNRIDADLAWSGSLGAGVKVGVIDTGIQLDHPDLAANIAGGYNAIRPWKSPNDDNGHGTHVAGTIAAVDNTIGVIGAAPSVSLYAIKVLDRNGSGWLSDVIEGLDWAVANGMQVVNMSLGTSSDVQAMHDAVTNAANAGVLVVAAAGNSGGSVGYPAAYPEAIAVSAIDNTDTIAYFSSRGPQVDFAAPGVSVYSTYKGSSYATLSGTSMATPHVAGTAALVWAANPTFTAANVLAKLIATADDLGAAGFDTLYGNGLVDAQEAVTDVQTLP